jgi:DNA mismatch repair ATPase MutS
MKILIDNNDNDKMKYTYKISKGISDIKGGLSVLKDLNYPDVIIKESNKLLKTIEL